MPAQSRRPSTRPSRAQRRAGEQSSRTYTKPTPTVSATGPTIVQRRTFMAEPAPVDHGAEFRAINKDLRRILIWAALIIIMMVVLSLVLG